MLPTPNSPLFTFHPLTFTLRLAETLKVISPSILPLLPVFKYFNTSHCFFMAQRVDLSELPGPRQV